MRYPGVLESNVFAEKPSLIRSSLEYQTKFRFGLIRLPKQALVPHHRISPKSPWVLQQGVLW